jgi:hypothetical protein
LTQAAAGAAIRPRQVVSRIGSTVWMQNGSMIVRAEDQDS